MFVACNVYLVYVRVYSVCDCVSFFISMRERHFFVFFPFFLLLLRYVKFFSHIRRKKSFNKVELTHGAAQRFVRFSFSFICYSPSRRRKEIRRNGDRRGIRRRFLVSFRDSFLLFVRISLRLSRRKKKKKQERDGAIVRFRWAPFARIASACMQIQIYP